MNFRIADTFTDSLATLTGDEQKSVKTTAFDLQLNPTNPGFSLHKLDNAKDKNFWSVRVNTDIRLIVHKTSDSLLLCYVGHHDNAYQWAEKRKLEIHPRTGAAQLVEIRERIEEITVAKYIEIERPMVAKPVLFAKHSDDELLGYGVPVEWLNDVRQATEDTILELAHLSGIGIKPHEMGVFVRSEAELDRAILAVSAALLNYKALDDHVETVNGHVSICTMHLAKDLEFRAVVVMACDDEVIPSQQRIETVTDDADLEDVYETERHLLYVACTRARDHLLITSGDIPSEFIDDLNVRGYEK